MNARIIGVFVLAIVVFGFSAYQTYQLSQQTAEADGVVEFKDFRDGEVYAHVRFDGGRSQYSFHSNGTLTVEVVEYDGGLVEFLSAGYLGDRDSYKVYPDRETGTYYRVLPCEEIGGGQAVCEEAPVDRLPPYHQEILRRGRKAAEPYVPYLRNQHLVTKS